MQSWPSCKSWLIICVCFPNVYNLPELFRADDFHISSLATQNGGELHVKPSKIVAGSEPVRTNELLVALAKVIEEKQKGSHAKTQVKSLPKGKIQANEKSTPVAKSPRTPTGKPAVGAVKKTSIDVKNSAPNSKDGQKDDSSRAKAPAAALKLKENGQTASKPSPLKANSRPEETVKKQHAPLKAKSIAVKSTPITTKNDKAPQKSEKADEILSSPVALLPNVPAAAAQIIEKEDHLQETDPVDKDAQPASDDAVKANPISESLKAGSRPDMDGNFIEPSTSASSIPTASVILVGFYSTARRALHFRCCCRGNGRSRRAARPSSKVPGVWSQRQR